MSGTSKKLTLYRGIYTDSYHADIIRDSGFDEKWALPMESRKFSRSEIDELLSKETLTLDDVRVMEADNKAFFACADERDACFYALWNKKGGYIGNGEIKGEEKYNGERKMYIIQFSVPLEFVCIDGSDSLYPMSYCAQKWEGENYDKLCKLFTKQIIDKYKPFLLNSNYDDNALVDLMSSEDEAILSFYNNKEILINGKHGIKLLSAFKVFKQITKEDIISVKETTEEECRSVIDSFKPKAQISHWFI